MAYGVIIEIIVKNFEDSGIKSTYDSVYRIDNTIGCGIE